MPNGRINTMKMICADPQIAARNMIVEVEHPVAGTYRMAGSPLKFGNYPDTTYEPAPTGTAYPGGPGGVLKNAGGGDRNHAEGAEGAGAYIRWRAERGTGDRPVEWKILFCA